MKATTVHEAKEAVKEFIRLGCQHVIITLGEQGAVYGSKDSATIDHITTNKTTAVDSTVSAVW